MKNDNRTDEEKEQAKQRRLANLKPFKPYDELTEEEKNRQREISQKGMAGMHRVVKEKKTMNELAKALLNQTITRDKAEKMLGESISLLPSDREIQLSDILNLCMVRETIDRGNVKAYEAIRDTAGYSPKQQIEISADIMTDSDRLLIDKISSRIG